MQRLGAIGQGFVNTFLRDNRVLPAVLALLALFVFAWILAGTYIDDPEEERVSNQTNVAQTQDAPGQDPVAPEIENRDVDSYAAYRNKDPFRQLLAPAEEQTSGQTSSPPADETTASPGPTSPGGGDTTTPGGRPRPDGGGSATDTEGDGTPDGADDSDGDGRPDGGRRGAGGNTGGPGGGANGGNGSGAGGGRGNGGGRDGGDDAGGRPGRNDDLLDSGGGFYAPYPAR